MKTEQEWLAIFKAWEESGLPQPEFCQSRGLGYAQFSLKRGELIAKGVIARYKRPIRLGKERVPALPTPTFTPIAFSQPVPLPSVPPKKPESAMIEIQLPHGIVLRIPTHVAV